jgi:hypothetical protein
MNTTSPRSPLASALTRACFSQTPVCVHSVLTAFAALLAVFLPVFQPQVFAVGAGGDTMPPTVQVNILSGPPQQVIFTIQDTGSGLSSIMVSRRDNVDTPVPPFTPTTTDPVIVTATRLDQSAPLKVVLVVSDYGGNVTTFEYPSTVVTTTADSGAGSLRDVIASAYPGDTITFSNNTNGGAENFYDGNTHAIVLSGTQLTVTKDAVILGPTGGRLNISGNDASRVFQINSGVT